MTIKRMLLVDLIEAFEDFLDEKGVVIPNEEKWEEPIENDRANIYGTDFGNLENTLESVLAVYGIEVSQSYVE